MLYHRAFAIVGIVASVAAVAAEPPTGAAKADAAKLQGTWRVTHLTDDLGPHQGKDVEEWTWEFRGATVTNRETKDEKGRPLGYTLNPAKTPKAIDLNDGGLVIEGIYKLDGDELTLCLVTGARNDKTAPRPSEFKADRQKKYSLFVLKRVTK